MNKMKFMMINNKKFILLILFLVILMLLVISVKDIAEEYTIISADKDVKITNTSNSQFEAYRIQYKNKPTVVVREKNAGCCEEYLIIHNRYVLRSNIIKKVLFLTFEDKTIGSLISITDSVKDRGEKVVFFDQGVEFSRGKETIRVIYNTKRE